MLLLRSARDPACVQWHKFDIPHMVTYQASSQRLVLEAPTVLFISEEQEIAVACMSLDLWPDLQGGGRHNL